MCAVFDIFYNTEPLAFPGEVSAAGVHSLRRLYAAESANMHSNMTLKPKQLNEIQPSVKKEKCYCFTLNFTLQWKLTC